LKTAKSTGRGINQIGSLHGFWSLRTSSAFKRQFDCAGHCNALLSWHGNHAPVSFSAIARSELIAAFAGLTRVRIKSPRCDSHSTLEGRTELGRPFERRSPRSESNTS